LYELFALFCSIFDFAKYLVQVCLLIFPYHELHIKPSLKVGKERHGKVLVKRAINITSDLRVSFEELAFLIKTPKVKLSKEWVSGAL